MLIPLLLLMVGGICLALVLCPIGEIAWQFIRLMSVIVLAIVTMIAVWFVYEALWRQGWASTAAGGLTMLAGLAALTVVTISPLLASPRSSVLLWTRVCFAIAAGAGFAAGLLWPGTTQPLASSLPVVATLSHILSGFFLGSVMVAWLLGHRYLTASQMTIDPLKRANQLMLVALGARWGFLVVMLVVASSVSAAGDAGSAALARMAGDWIPLSMRIGMGLVLPTVFAIMAWQCVKLRSTQSATGILFFMSVFVLIGELTSRYLAGRTGVAL